MLWCQRLDHRAVRPGGGFQPPGSLCSKRNKAISCRMDKKEQRIPAMMAPAEAAGDAAGHSVSLRGASAPSSDAHHLLAPLL